MNCDGIGAYRIEVYKAKTNEHIKTFELCEECKYLLIDEIFEELGSQ